MTVAGCCVAGYVVDGITANGWLGLGAALVCLVAVMAAIMGKVPSLEK